MRGGSRCPPPVLPPPTEARADPLDSPVRAGERGRPPVPPPVFIAGYRPLVLPVPLPPRADFPLYRARPPPKTPPRCCPPGGGQGTGRPLGGAGCCPPPSSPFALERQIKAGARRRRCRWWYRGSGPGPGPGTLPPWRYAAPPVARRAGSWTPPGCPVPPGTRSGLGAVPRLLGSSPGMGLGAAPLGPQPQIPPGPRLGLRGEDEHGPASAPPSPPIPGHIFFWGGMGSSARP